VKQIHALEILDPEDAKALREHLEEED
jgi:hypothetical protein